MTVTATEPETLPSWNLADYYAAPDDPKFSEDLDKAKHLAQEFAASYRGKVAALSATEMAEALAALETLSDHLYRPYIYASLLHSADSKPAEHGRLKGMAQETAAEIEKVVLFFDLELVEIDDAKAEELIGASELEHFAHYIRRKRQMKPHLLSEAEEKILAQTSPAGRQAWNRMFHEIVDYLTFPIEGEEEEKPLDQVMTRLYDPDRETRRKAAEAVTVGLKRAERPLTFLYNTILLDKKIGDNLRSFEKPADSRNLSNEIDQASLDALLEACEKYHPMVERYYRLKGQLLGVDDLKDYDRYAPLGDVAREFEYDEARDIVMKSFTDFSDDFAAIAGRFFEKDWIDVPPREGKRHGAFCSGGVPSVHSYVLLNYTKKASDVKTLAHELGHGVHFELAREKLSLLTLDPTLCLAETASVFAEKVVFDRLVRETTDPQDRLALICQELEQSFATVFRQVGFTRFEMAAHKARREEGELSTDRLSDLWMESGQPMFGEALTLREGYRNWWLYIPHFIHTPFYCYAYSYGKLLTLALYGVYREEGDSFVPKYMELLGRGGSASPEELLKPLGVDTRDPAFWSKGLDMLEADVAEAEKLAASLK